MTCIHRMLVPTDGSIGAAAAGVFAARLARDLKAEISVVTVVDTSPLAEAYGDAAFRAQRIAEIHARAAEQAAHFAEQHFATVAPASAHVRDGNTPAEIIQAARDLGSDLIVMGTHGRTGITHLLIGSVAEMVVRASPIPVLTVRAPE
ncbi:MAG: universal stress protein [Candidatus Binatia bacterium]